MTTKKISNYKVTIILRKTLSLWLKQISDLSLRPAALPSVSAPVACVVNGEVVTSICLQMGRVIRESLTAAKVQICAGSVAAVEDLSFFGLEDCSRVFFFLCPLRLLSVSK